MPVISPEQNLIYSWTEIDFNPGPPYINDCINRCILSNNNLSSLYTFCNGLLAGINPLMVSHPFSVEISFVWSSMNEEFCQETKCANTKSMVLTVERPDKL